MSQAHFFVDMVVPLVRLSAEDSRHALRSLRLHPGEPVSVSDGRGAVGSGRLGRQEGGRAVVEVIESHRVERAAPRLSIALAPPSGDRLSWAVQKLAELGTDELILVPSERSVRRWTPERAARALPRLRAVAKEAAMQSRQAFAMELTVTTGLAQSLDFRQGPALLCAPGAKDPLMAAVPGDVGALRLFIGPEGGFGDEDLETARRAGARLVSLGPNVLRTETAAVVAATLVLASTGRLG